MHNSIKTHKTNESEKKEKKKNIDDTSTIADHNSMTCSNQSCVVYKFQSRPPYEGFILILVIVVVIVLLLWWLNSRISSTE
jgi:hypothetical protein